MKRISIIFIAVMQLSFSQNNNSIDMNKFQLNIETARLEKRICSLLKKNNLTSCKEVDYKFLHIYFFHFEGNNIGTHLRNRTLLDSIRPSFYQVSKGFRNISYLVTTSFIFDSKNNLIGVGDARNIMFTTDLNYPDETIEDLIGIMSNSKVELTMILGKNGLQRLGIFLLIKDNDYYYYQQTITGLIEISENEYISLITAPR